MQIKELVKKAHVNAKEKGFWDKPSEIGTLLMLVVSELGEGLEAVRENRIVAPETLDKCKMMKDKEFEKYFKTVIKDSFQDELADVFIRLADLCGYYKIDIEKHIELKMRYNATRPRLHGKRF